MTNKKMIGIGFLTDGDREYLILSEEPSFPTHYVAVLSVMDLYVARRYFIEKSEDGILGGKDLFLTPHWKSLYGDYPCSIEWFPEPREFEVEDRWEVNTVLSQSELSPKSKQV